MDSQTSALAQDIAAHLGWATTTVPQGWGVVLHGPEGEELFAQPARQAARVAVHGLYPGAEPEWRLPTHQITAAVSRGPAAIAADIRGRLLPGYRKDLAAARETIARLAAEDAQRSRLAARLVAAIPGATTSSTHARGHDTTIHWYTGEAAGGGTIRLWGDGSRASLELSSVPAPLTAAIAAAVGHTIRTHRQAGQAGQAGQP